MIVTYLVLVMSLPGSTGVTSQTIEVSAMKSCIEQARKLEKEAGQYDFMKAYCVVGVK